MNHYIPLSLADAQQIVDAALLAAEQQGWKVAVAVCDLSGQLVCLKRTDGAAPISAEIAHQKAYCSALTQKSSNCYEEMINQGRFAALAMPIAPLRGGEPILRNGYQVAAIGVSGVKPEQDEQVALAGLSALE